MGSWSVRSPSRDVFAGEGAACRSGIEVATNPTNGPATYGGTAQGQVGATCFPTIRERSEGFSVCTFFAVRIH